MSRLARSVFGTSSQFVLRGRSGSGLEIPTVLSSWRHSKVTSELVEVGIRAVTLASERQLSVGDNHQPEFDAFNKFPGEHYRLLSALACTLDARKIVEVGTYTGMGSLSLVQGNERANLVTFDVIPWNDPSLATHLSQNDFVNKGGRIRQELADLAEVETFSRFKLLLEDADLIFLDAPKNDRFEYEFARNLTTLAPSTSRFLVIDDIHFLNMVDLWRSIDSPKLDLTSFGHFSGTGLVDISQGFSLKA